MPKRSPRNHRWSNDSDLPRGSSVTPCPAGPAWPTTPPANSETYSVDDYIKMYEAKHCRKMTPEEKATLSRGCIGITALELGTSGNPSLDNCYSTLDQAKARAKTMKSECAKDGRTPQIFSKRFYSDGKDYTPDPITGKIDMGNYDYKAKPGYVNFDYGYYDEASNSFWHANHSEPGMKVYRSTQGHYSRPLLDFDKQVYGVACGKP